MYEKFGQFIDGNWSPSADKGTYEVINPATEEILGHASKATSTDVDKALKSAEKRITNLEKNNPLGQILYS
ncbi:aldehyde dehydrogenase family protein [Candidatus Pelagibacter ubique]|nr:aldehyde dehydrogenase family protein [Candidatus Pelagibacter ubique]